MIAKKLTVYYFSIIKFYNIKLNFKLLKLFWFWFYLIQLCNSKLKKLYLDLHVFSTYFKIFYIAQAFKE